MCQDDCRDSVRSLEQGLWTPYDQTPARPAARAEEGGDEGGAVAWLGARLGGLFSLITSPDSNPVTPNARPSLGAPPPSAMPYRAPVRDTPLNQTHTSKESVRIQYTHAACMTQRT